MYTERKELFRFLCKYDFVVYCDNAPNIILYDCQWLAKIVNKNTELSLC